MPFALLLSRDLKRNFKMLRSIAIFILLMRFVDLYWLITPSFRTTRFGVSLAGFHRPVGMVGLWLAYFLTQLQKRPLMPKNAPHLEEALEHGRD